MPLTLVRTVCVLLLLSVAPVRSAPQPEEPDARFPEALRSWEGWVLRDDLDLACPLASNQPARLCAWPGTLALRMRGDTATFEQGW